MILLVTTVPVTLSLTRTPNVPLVWLVTTPVLMQFVNDNVERLRGRGRLTPTPTSPALLITLRANSFHPQRVTSEATELKALCRLSVAMFKFAW